ncbi:MAG: hypothetical protein AABM66_14445 [Actinomycetota bacterium]
MSAVDVAIDSLVAEALDERSASARTVVPVRALTDLTVWRSLREQDGSREATAEKASAAVERWLEGRPASPQPAGSAGRQ